MRTEVWAQKAHPAMWEFVSGHWRMTQSYHELWQMFLSGEMSETKFRQRQRELMAAYDSDEPPF
jgi:uncharacterized cupin superfamily protein